MRHPAPPRRSLAFRRIAPAVLVLLTGLAAGDRPAEDPPAPPAERAPQARPEPSELPPEEDLKALVTEAVLAYAEAARSGDFRSYHKSLSTALRAEVTPEQLKEAAAGLAGDAEGVAAVADVEPVFEQGPEADDEGVVSVAGFYATEPRPVRFFARFVRERRVWKVRGISVEVAESSATTRATTKPAGPVVPPEDVLKKLIAGTLLEWNRCVQAGDFQPLYDKAAEPFREQITPRRLHVTFQRFVEQGANIEAIGRVDPVIEKGPVVDGGRVLSVQGRYPTTPFHVGFELRYLYEEGEWKLLVINVKRLEPGKAGKKDSGAKGKDTAGAGKVGKRPVAKDSKQRAGRNGRAGSAKAD